MQRAVAIGAILGTGLVLGGCASSEQDYASQWQPKDRAPLVAADASGEPMPATLPVQAGDDVSIPADAGPEQYVGLALERNPSIAAVQHRIEGLKARIPQVTSLDDPMLEVAPIGEMAQTAAGMVGTMTSISQKLPFPGKLGTQGRIAAQEVAMAVQDLEQTKLSVIADTRRAYWSYYFADRAIDVTQQTRELLRQFQQIADARFRAGTTNQSDVLRASTELSNLDNELITLRQQQTTAAAMLNSLMDRPVTAPLPKPQPAELTQIDLRLQTLLAEASRANPELERIRQRIEAQRYRQKLARLGYFPDLTVGVNYNFVNDDGLSPVANGKDQWWIGFGINIPIWFEKYRAGEREALQGRQEAIADLGDAQNRIAFRVQDALARVQTQQRLVQLFRDVIVPQAQQTVDASQAGYQAGRVDFLTLVDNWRKLLNYELMYHQNLAELEKDFAELEQVVGRDIGRATVQPSTRPATAPGMPALR